MAHMSCDAKLKNLKKEMEGTKNQLQRLPEMEKMMECLTRGLSRVIVALEETQESVLSLGRSNSEEKNLVEESDFTHVPIIKLPPYSDLGLEGPNTMQFRGRIGSKEVKILIKPRASVNFISTEVIEELQLQLRPTTNYWVVMRSNVTRSSGICKGVSLEMEGLKIVEDYLPLRLAGCADIILGMKWLKTLRKIDIDWRELVLKFVRDDALIFLKACPSL